MSSSNAFTPTGNTVTFTAAGTAPTPIQASGNTLGPTQYLVQNAGFVTVFLGYGANSSVATSNAATITTTGNSVPLVAGSVQVLTLQPNLFFTGVASSNTSVYITPGEGI